MSSTYYIPLLSPHSFTISTPQDVVLVLLKALDLFKRPAWYTVMLWLLIGIHAMTTSLTFLGVLLRLVKGSGWFFTKTPTEHGQKLRPNVATTSQICFGLFSLVLCSLIPTYVFRQGTEHPPTAAASIVFQGQFLLLCLAFHFMVWGTVWAPPRISLTGNDIYPDAAQANIQLAKMTYQSRASLVIILIFPIFTLCIFGILAFCAVKRRSTMEVLIELRLESLESLGWQGRGGADSMEHFQQLFSKLSHESNLLKYGTWALLIMYLIGILAWTLAYFSPAFRLLRSLRAHKRRLNRTIKSLSVLAEIVEEKGKKKYHNSDDDMADYTQASQNPSRQDSSTSAVVRHPSKVHLRTNSRSHLEGKHIQGYSQILELNQNDKAPGVPEKATRTTTPSTQHSLEQVDSRVASVLGYYTQDSSRPTSLRRSSVGSQDKGSHSRCRSLRFIPSTEPMPTEMPMEIVQLPTLSSLESPNTSGQHSHSDSMILPYRTETTENTFENMKDSFLLHGSEDLHNMEPSNSTINILESQSFDGHGSEQSYLGTSVQCMDSGKSNHPGPKKLKKPVSGKRLHDSYSMEMQPPVNRSSITPSFVRRFSSLMRVGGGQVPVQESSVNSRKRNLVLPDTVEKGRTKHLSMGGTTGARLNEAEAMLWKTKRLFWTLLIQFFTTAFLVVAFIGLIILIFSMPYSALYPTIYITYVGWISGVPGILSSTVFFYNSFTPSVKQAQEAQRRESLKMKKQSPSKVAVASTPFVVATSASSLPSEYQSARSQYGGENEATTLVSAPKPSIDLATLSIRGQSFETSRPPPQDLESKENKRFMSRYRSIRKPPGTATTVATIDSLENHRGSILIKSVTLPSSPSVPKVAKISESSVREEEGPEFADHLSITMPTEDPSSRDDSDAVILITPRIEKESRGKSIDPRKPSEEIIDFASLPSSNVTQTKLEHPFIPAAPSPWETDFNRNSLQIYGRSTPIFGWKRGGLAGSQRWIPSRWAESEAMKKQ